MTSGTRRRLAAGAIAAAVLCSACAINRTGIEPDEPTRVDITSPQVEPTAISAPPPTAVFVPIEPTATPPPPTPTPPPPDPTPTVEDLVTVDPVLTAAGMFTRDNVSFVLSEDRLVSRLPGHTLVYLDENLQAEVDVFTPVADFAGNVLADFSDVISFIENDPELAGLDELAPVTIAGRPTRVFAGTAAATQRSFFTDAATIQQTEFGWFAPARMQLWVIDAPGATFIVSAEALQDPGQFSDAVRLATEILSTIEFR